MAGTGQAAARALVELTDQDASAVFQECLLRAGRRNCVPDQRQAARVHGATGRKVRRKERRRRQHKPRPGASWRGQADARLRSPHLGPGARTAVFTGRINEHVFAEQMKSGRALGDPWQHGCQSGPCPVLSPLPPGASPLACFSQDLSHGTKTGKGAIFPELSPQATAPAAGYPATASHPCPSRPLLRACPPFCGREGGREASLRQGLPAARGCRGGPGSLPTRRVCSPGRADVFWRQARELAPRQLPGRWLGSPCSRTLQPLWAQSPETAGIQGACTQPCRQALAVWATAVLATARPPLLPEPTQSLRPGPQAAAGPPRFTEKDTEAPDVPQPARGGD